MGPQRPHHQEVRRQGPAHVHPHRRQARDSCRRYPPPCHHPQAQGQEDPQVCWQPAWPERPAQPCGMEVISLILLYAATTPACCTQTTYVSNSLVFALIITITVCIRDI